MFFVSKVLPNEQFSGGDGRGEQWFKTARGFFSHDGIRSDVNGNNEGCQHKKKHKLVDHVDLEALPPGKIFGAQTAELGGHFAGEIIHFQAATHSDHDQRQRGKQERHKDNREQHHAVFKHF